MRRISFPGSRSFAASPAHGLDGAGETLRILIDEASKIERARAKLERIKPGRAQPREKKVAA